MTAQHPVIRLLGHVSTTPEARAAFPTSEDRAALQCYLYGAAGFVYSHYPPLARTPVAGHVCVAKVMTTRDMVLTGGAAGRSFAHVLGDVPFAEAPTVTWVDRDFDPAADCALSLEVTDKSRVVLTVVIVLPADAASFFGRSEWEDIRASLQEAARTGDIANGDTYMCPALGRPTTCAGCGANGQMKRCSGCSLAWFCGDACIRAHWHEHKAFCKHMQRARGGATARIA